MAAENDAKNTAQDLIGKGKEALGNLTNNDKLVAEGKADQAEASLKKGVENVKDAAKDAFDKK
jgi:uncharacterized protein YjbJ (UPF0337 family)